MIEDYSKAWIRLARAWRQFSGEKDLVGAAGTLAAESTTRSWKSTHASPL